MAKKKIASNYIKTGKNKEALETYENIIEEHPNLYGLSSYAQYQIGRYYEERKKIP